MTVEALLLAATTLIALVAVVAAVVAVRAIRRLERQVSQSVVEVRAPAGGTSRLRGSLETTSTGDFEGSFAATGGTSRPRSGWGTTTEIGTSTADVSSELAPRVVQGRVVVPPSQAQVVRTALGRPGARLNIFVHGLARALRSENRDRIVALMRREFRHRRRERLRAGRRAVRMSRPTSAPSTDRLHAEFAEPKPLSLTDRMVSS